MIPFYINNLPSQNNTVSTLGNSITVQLDKPLLLDEQKKYHMRLLQANIVYCTPNVFTNVNNQLTYTYTDSNNNTFDGQIIFDQGLYGLSDINAKISMYTDQNNNNSSLFGIIADASTSKIIIYMKQDNIVIHAGDPYSIMTMLGFPSSIGDIQIPTGKTAPYYIYGSTQANLNSVQNIYIKCDIVTGSYLNSQSTNIIAGVVPDVASYSTIIYRPYFPTRVQINARRIDSITVSLVGDDNKDLDIGTHGGQTKPELWSVLITIESDELKLSHEQN